MQGKIVIQKRLKHAVMNRPRRTALGNSEPPFALPAGGPAPVLPRCRGGQQLYEAARFPPALVLLPPGPAAGSGTAGPGAPPPARLPELPQAAFTRGISAVQPGPRSDRGRGGK